MELSPVEIFGTTLELESAFNEAYRYATESHVISVEDADHVHDAKFINPKVMKYIVIQAFIRLMADEADIVAYVSR